MKKTHIILFALLLLSLNSCRTFRELKTLSNCDFEFESLDNVILADVALKDAVSFTDIGFSGIRKITSAFKKDEMILSFLLNVKATNPNPKTAALNRIDWIVYLDKLEMTSGSVNNRVEIESGGEAIIPINIELDLKKVFAEESLKGITNFVFNLLNSSDEASKMAFKIRPSFMVGKKEITYGNFITIKTKVKSEE